MNLAHDPAPRNLIMRAMHLALLGVISLATSAQTVTTNGNPNYATSNNGVPGNGVVTFAVANNSGGDILVTDLEAFWQVESNGANTTLWASTVSLSGPYFPFNLPDWTVVGTGTNLSVPADGYYPTISGMNYLIPNAVTVRFLLESDDAIEYRGTGTLPGAESPNTFTTAGVSLHNGDFQIAGQYVGYGGVFTNAGNNPRYFMGGITFMPAAPCAGTPSAGTITGPAFVCSGSSATLNLVGSTTATGISRDWFSSTVSGGPYTTPVGSGASVSTGPVTSNTFYVCVVTCANGGGTATSGEFELNVTGAYPGGTFTIDNTLPTAGSNFNNFTDAINTVNGLVTCGAITGPIIVNVTAGQVFPEDPPALTASGNPGNGIIFQRSGSGANPVITPTGGAATNDAGITLAGADYITFSGIDVDASAVSTVEYGYLIRNASATDGASFNTFENFTVRLDRTNTTSRGVLQAASTTGGGFTPTSAAGNNNSNTYRDFSIRSAFGGFWALTGSTTWWDDGTTITTSGCGTFNSIGDPAVPGDIGNAVTTATYGIQMTNQNGFVIENCDVRNVTNTTGQLDGINAVSFSGLCRINNCVVRNIEGTGSTTTVMAGIRAAQSTVASVPAPFMRIYNNLVADISRAYTGAASTIRGVRGINLPSTSSTNAPAYEIWNNTVRIDGSASPNLSNSCFETNNPIAGASLIVRNNIFANFTAAQSGTVRHYGFVHSNNAAQIGNAGSAASNNDIYIANDLGTSGFTALSLSTNRNGVVAWQGAVAQAADNLEVDPQLLITLESAAAGLNGTGFTPLPAFLTVDFGCAPRQADIGAYNIEACTAVDAGTISGGATACNDDAEVILSLNGSTTGLGITRQWKYATTPGGPYPNDLGTILIQDVAALAPGTYYIVVEVTCSFGPTTATTPEFVLQVFPNPSASATNSGPLCEGDQLDLDGTTDIGTSFSWTGPGGYSSSDEDPMISSVTPANGGVYTFTATADGCSSAPATTTVSIGPAPVFSSVTADPNPVCNGEDSQLSATALVDVPYVRISEVIVFRTGTGAGTIPPYIDASVNDFVELNNTSGLAADISGWSIADYASNATTSSHPTLTFPGGTVIPPNGVLVVGFGAGTGGDPSNNYYVTGGSNDQWLTSSVVGFVLKDAGNNVVDVIARGAFTWNPATGVTATDWSGTITTGSTGSVRTVSLDSNTAADWTTMNTAGGTLGIYNSAYGYINPDQSAPASYLWTPATFLDDPNAADPLAEAVTAATTYTVTATSAAGCSSDEEITVSLATPLTTVTIDPISPEYCAGGSVELTATPVDGGAPYIYAWTDPSSNPAGTDAAQLANIPGLWSVSVSDNCGGAPVVASVTVVENPTPTASASAGQACLGGTLELDGTTDIGTTLSWTGPNSFSSSDEDPSISPVVAATGGVYTFTATLGNCTSLPSTVAVSVDPSPTIVSTTATPNPVCTGNDAQLNVVATLPGYTMGSGGTTFIDISGTGTAIPSVTDDSEHNITIPGGFTFNGVNYTDARVGANGVIVFGATAGEISLTNAALPTGTVAAGPVFLAPWWDDIDNDAGGGQIFIGQSGNLLIAQWNNWGRSPAVAGQVITFQVQLNQLTGEIFFVYNDVIFGGSQAAANDFGLNATVGIQWANSAGNFIQYSFNQASLSDGQVISFAPIAVNSYLWSPSTFLSADDIANPIAQDPTATTPYSVLVTADNGCTATGGVTLTVNESPDVDLTLAETCGSNQFSISVQVNSTGNGPTIDLSYTVNGGTPIVVPGLGTGPQTPLGPFNQLDEVVVTVIDPVGGCNSDPQLFITDCPEFIACDFQNPIVLSKSYCYGNNDTRSWLFQVSPGEQVRLRFLNGMMEPNDLIRVHDGQDANAPDLGSSSYADLTDVTFITTQEYLYLAVESDAALSCQDGSPGTSTWNWEVSCNPPCISPIVSQPLATFDCFNQTYTYTLDLFFSGTVSQEADFEYSVNGGTPVTISDVPEGGSEVLGPFNFGDQVQIYVRHDEDAGCDLNVGLFEEVLAEDCPNDEPCSPWQLTMNPNYTCAVTTAGNMTDATLTAGITGGCASVLQDQWFRFTATATTHRVQLGGTTTGLSHSIYEGSPDCTNLTLVAGTGCTAGATASNPAGLTPGTIYYVRVSRTTAGTNAYTVCVSAPPLIDADATILVLPATPACYGANETVSVRVLNNSIYTLDMSVDALTVNVTVAGAASANLTGTLNTGTVAPGATVDVEMSTTLDMSAAGTYNFTGTAVVAGDGNAANDAMTAASRTTVASTALPITQNFTGFTGSNLATLAAPNNGWREATGATAPGTGTTSAWTSSLAAQQTQLGSGVSARINLVGTARNEWLLGPKFIPQLGTVLRYRIAITDLSSGGVDPAGMQGTDDRVRVMISNDCGATWNELFAHNASNTAAITNSLVQQQIDLGAYIGDEVIIGFLAQDGPVDDVPSYDFHVDDISVENIAVCAGPPVAGIANSSVPGPACAPASTTLSVSGQSTDGGVVVTWWGSNTPGGPYSINEGTGTVLGMSGLTATRYWVASVKCLSTNDSTLTAEVSTVVTPTPTAEASAGPACTGQSLQLTGTTDFGTSFSWIGPNGFSSTDQNPVVDPVETASAGTYTFTATANGCPASDGEVVVVNTTPVITSLTATPNPVCEGTGTSQLSVTAPAPGYVMGSGGATFIDISGTGTAIPGVTDDSENNITIPGGFTFNGVNYTDARVGANGVIVFGATAGEISLTNAALPTGTVAAGPVFLAPWWDDIDNDAGGGQIFIGQSGNLLIAQWNNWGRSPAVAGQVITFQVQLNQLTGEIFFVYNDVIFGGSQAAANDFGLNATVGIQWANSAGNFIQYSFNQASLTDGQVISFTPNQAAFQWTPSTNLSADNIADPVFGPATEGSYSYNVTATAAGCTSAPSPITIDVNPALMAGEAEILPVGASFCTGSDVILTANPLGGGGPFTYAWTDPSSNPAGTDETQVVNVPGLWSVAITDNCGGSASASITVVEFPVPVATVGSNSPVCAGETIELEGSSDIVGSTFAWTGPNGFTSSDEDPVITNSTVAMSGSYSLVATANGCSSAPMMVSVSVGSALTGVSASASDIVVCEPGGTIDLFSTGGLSPTILIEDFNGLAPGWTTTNNSTTTGTGNVALTAWTQRPDGYIGDTGGAIHSNDNSSFYSSSSDDGGSGSTTNTTLVSPPFSLVGYSSANLSFWHHYNFLSTESANVEITTDGGGSWIPLVTYTTDQGTPTAFANPTIPLDAYVGLAGLQIRFRYAATWDWYWAVDNVSVSGAPLPASFTWSSDPSGFSSADQNPSGVAFSATTTYTVTVEALGCSATADVTVYLGTNFLTLEVQTDGNGDEITYELVEVGSGDVYYAAGGTFPDNQVVPDFSCLPDGCFHLRVLDAGGDGIANGGYVLRESDGSQRRIIDNRYDEFGTGGFTAGGLSAIASTGEFCLPLSDDRLIYTSCDKRDWKLSPCGGEYVVANANAAVTAEYGVNNANSGYQMWWYAPNGGYSFKRFQSHNTSNGLPASATRAAHFLLNGWAGNQLTEGGFYNVKVRGRVNGVYNNWGPACRLVVNSAEAQCPRTKLMDLPGNQFLSCGQTRDIGTNIRVHAKPVRRMNNNCNWVNANRYQFRFRIPAEFVTIVKTSATGQYWVNTNGLACGRTYEVDVRASFDNGATWCHSSDPYGDVCLLNTTACSFNLAQEHGGASSTDELRLVMYPNPNRGDQLTLGLSSVEEGVQTVAVDIYDAYGKRVVARTLTVQDGFVNQVLDLEGALSGGMYMVNLTAGGRTYTERLVIQR